MSPHMALFFVTAHPGWPIDAHSTPEAPSSGAARPAPLLGMQGSDPPRTGLCHNFCPPPPPRAIV